MATAKKNNYIEEELSWLEAKAAEIKNYVDDNPYDQIEDRIVSLQSGKGVADKVVATKEAVRQDIRKALSDYSMLVEAIGKLRTQEEAKKHTPRGEEDLSPFESRDF